MTQVTGLTAERMQEIIDDTIASGEIVDGNLILHRNNGTDIDLGSVGGVAKETFFPTIPAPEDGDLVIRIDLPGDPLYKYTDGVWELQPRMGSQTVPSVRAQISGGTQSVPNVTKTAIALSGADAHDTDSMHDVAVNNTRITINTPGLYWVGGYLSWSAFSTTGRRAGDIFLNGTTIVGEDFRANSSESLLRTEVNAGILRLAAGDYLEIRAYQDTGAARVVDGATLSAVWLGGFGQTIDERGVPAVKAVRSTNQSIPNASATAVSFTDPEEYDTDSMHDTVTNATRITIKTPGLYRITSKLLFPANATGVRQVEVRKNGAVITNGFNLLTANSVNSTSPEATYDLQLAAGDYIEVLAYQNSTAALNVTASVAATMLASGKTVTPFTKIGRTVDQTIPYNVATGVGFDSELSDNDGMHDTVTNNNRITIRTAGIYTVSAAVNYAGDSSGYRQIAIRKNGTDEAVDRKIFASSLPSWLAVSINIECAVGDYIELFAYHTVVAGLNIVRVAGSSPILTAAKIGSPNGGNSGLGPAQADMYTIATLPAANTFPNGRIVGVSDGAGGQQARMAMNGAWINLG